MPLVYVVEDDEDISYLLAFNLKKEGFQVKPFLSSVEALKSLETTKPDIILLDIMLPDIDGLEFCKLVKSNPETEDIPIIMITAKGTEIDKIVGLELGADDYITKPFSIKEVIARIKAILRRVNKISRKKTPPKKDLQIFPDKFEVVVDGEKVNLTPTEFKLLNLLVNSDGKVLTREKILETVWNNNYEVFDRTVDVHIKNLRDKLGDYGKRIKTVRGIGYKWEVD
ncbi:MAG: response regulator transcription factor [Aquificae bacterium]|nr:response regulator transcription factor [Aquificota bacterium]